MPPQLEICAFSLNSCKIAADNGADRIELCSNPHEGGTTPSHGMIATARRLVAIPVFPIIRPRGGDFLYSHSDFLAMQKDIQFCKSVGCEGVVVGMLTEDGSVDVERLSILVRIAYPMEVTFHRAFDRSSDPFAALEKIVETGCQRILTSGLKPTVDEGCSLLVELVAAASERIIIMPGSGVRAGNIAWLAIETGAHEFHTSARTMVPSAMKYVNGNMQEDLSLVECDGKEIREIAAALKIVENSIPSTNGAGGA